MKWRLIDESLPGFENYKTIEFNYWFANGQHTTTGVNYSGTSRRAFLPASDEGKIVFKMLVEAFNRRLTFVVGTSLTTGQTNTVVWAGIHHKTSFAGGPFGYPDDKYLGRVTEELKARDIDADSVKDLKVDFLKGLINLK